MKREGARQGEREREGAAAYTSYRSAAPRSNNKTAAAVVMLEQYGVF